MNRSIWIRCGRLFDGVHDELRENAEILIEGNRIVSVGKDLTCPAETERIDLSHLTVTPGLIDAHMHTDVMVWQEITKGWEYEDSWYTLAHLRNAQKSLERGFTSIRTFSMIPWDYGVLDVKKAIARGLFSGSRIFAAAHQLGSPGGHCDYSQRLSNNPRLAELCRPGQIGSGADFFSEQVRKEKMYGSDFIKIMMSGGFFTPADGPEEQQLTDAELSAIMESAHNAAMKVTAHVYHDPLIQKLIRFGIDGIEHGALMGEETAHMLEEAQKSNHYVSLIPTFCPYDDIIRSGESDTAGKPPEMVEKLKKYGSQLKKSREIIVASKIELGYGTDFVTAHQCYESWREFYSWLMSGINPFRALRAATSVNAKILGMEQKLGTIEPGKLADLSGWHRDILSDPFALAECDFVMKDGVRYPTAYNEDLTI